MKYIKLFESWLNEAEEGQAEVKPFDPKKPGETLVVDITGNDLSKDDDKYTRKIIESILGRCVKKDEKGTDPDLTVIKFKIDEVVSKSTQNTMVRISVKEENEGGNYKYIDMYGNELPESLEDTYVYYISKYTSEDWVSDKRTILRKPKTFLVFDTGKNTMDGFALDREYLIVDFSSDKGVSLSKEKPIKTTLGGICALATTNFDNLAVLKDANEAKPQNIAKALGYEIPENYTPKQGVTKREERS